MFRGSRAMAATFRTTSPVSRSVILCHASSTAGTPDEVSWPPIQSVGSRSAVRAPSSAAVKAAASAAVDPPTIMTS